MTKPDISCAIQVLSQFVANSYCTHHITLFRKIQYVRGFISQGVYFRSDSSIHLEGYIDADWASCSNTLRFVNGWCMFLCTSLILEI